MIKKLTPKKLLIARKEKSIIRWRASGKNGTLIANPTLKDLLNAKQYQKRCEQYVKLMMRVIIANEISLDKDLDLKPHEYYFKRYDVTAVECKILRNEIMTKLN